jgi:hypothetical protein
MVKYYLKKYYFMNVSQSQVDILDMEEQYIFDIMDIVNFDLYVKMNVKQQLIIMVNSVI